MEARCFSFGPFVLIPDRQLLLREDAPVRLGTRALEILSILVQRPGEVIDKQELISLVWPDTFVDESNLKVNIAVIRRALDEAGSHPSCIATVIGRGYRFIEPVQAFGMDSSAGRAKHSCNLPSSPRRLIGRDKVIHQLAAQVDQNRLVTVVGSAGIGKTAVAIAVAETLAQRYENGACFADLGLLDDPRLVPHAIAAAVGLKGTADNINERLMAYLIGKHLLLLIDTCERVIDAATAFVEQTQSCCPQVHLLATSRETLRANGERVYRLPGLCAPPFDVRLTAAEVRSYPAVQLFLEQAAETVDECKISDSELVMIADLCRELNGVPLAIELAARRVRSLGFDGMPLVATDYFSLFNQGQRTGPRRHQNLAAALDWSFELLPENERFVLLRLSQLEGCFDLEMGIAVASNGAMSRMETAACIANLVSKSLIERLEHGRSYFRLLASIRHYASQKLISDARRGLSEVYGEKCDGPGWEDCQTERTAPRLEALVARAS
jgi:predicted ATPase/DNA-binding winged helix-turn-helix (wHTH) protein